MLSSSASQESSGQTMLLSAAPAGIRKLAEFYDSRTSMTITVEDLDKIVDGTYEKIERLESKLADGDYLRAYLPAVDWWIDVTQSLSWGRFDGSICDPDHNQPFEREKTNLLKRLNDALSIYSAALAEDIDLYDPASSKLEFGRAPMSIAFLKRYRLYTRAVCAVARECWPDADLDWLFQQG